MSERLPEVSVLRIVPQSWNILELRQGKKNMLICLDRETWKDQVTTIQTLLRYLY